MTPHSLSPLPPPRLKDGAVVNTSSMAGLSLQPEDSSLLIENISLPLEALAGGVADLSGLYTCSAENIAGVVTASSYVFPFGSKFCVLNEVLLFVNDNYKYIQC